MTRLVGLFALSLVLGSCKGDGTGPSVLFPTLPDQMLQSFCNRGQRAPDQAISGSLTDTDCDFGDGSFFEVWRVRVATAGTYQFAATSSFDNLIFIVRLDAYDDTSATTTQIGDDDDSGPGSNALVNVALQPNTDYFMAINGFGASDVGPYTATITAVASPAAAAAGLPESVDRDAGDKQSRPDRRIHGSRRH